MVLTEKHVGSENEIAKNARVCSRFVDARYGSQMSDGFLYCGDHRNQKSGEIKGISRQPPSPPPLFRSLTLR